MMGDDQDPEAQMETLSLSPPRSDPNPNPETTPPQKPSLNSFLDPPSYADAMFRSFDDLDVDPNHATSCQSQSNGHDSPSPPHTSPYIHITVSDPQKHLTYHTYLITTRTNLQDFSRPEFSVRRRFREVVALSESLAEGYRGYFIPLRPDKAVMESKMMNEGEFVEQRRVAVEKYLRKLAGHPVIRGSEELRVFLEEEGRVVEGSGVGVLEGVAKLPGQVLGERGAEAREKGGRDLMRLFKELRQAVANDWSGVKPPVVEEDREFIEKKGRLSELEQHLVSVSEQVY